MNLFVFEADSITSMPTTYRVNYSKLSIIFIDVFKITLHRSYTPREESKGVVKM